MAISNINLSLNPYGAASGQAQDGPARQNPLDALQRKEESAIAQLSAFGKVTASLADLQDKAQGLSNFSKPPSFKDFQVAVQGFVQAFNSLKDHVGQLASQSALGADNRPSQALNNVRQALAGPNHDGFSALQKMGVTRQANGAFSINQKQLDKSYQDNPKGTLATFSDLAQRVSQAAGRQVSANGPIGKKMGDLNARVNELQSMRHTAEGYLDKQKKTQQSLTAQFSGAVNYAAHKAVSAYLGVASL